MKYQFAILWDYVNEIDRNNPGTSIYMKFTDNEMPDKTYRFQRIYLCFAACKEAFNAGCRKIVGVDGCWLKGPMYGNQLLTAVGLDANNNIFPIAYVVVERETTETWAWFLNHLVSDLEIDYQESWTFMSDKQKGLIEAFNEALPYVGHRFCVRRLHNNFKGAGFIGESLKHALWTAAKATTVKLFDICMEKMYELDAEAATWLNENAPSEWTKSHFSSGAKCDVLLNNMCESFNSTILDARDKPNITLLEKLRYLLLARFQVNRDKAERWNSGDICPRIKSLLHKNESAAAACIPRKSNMWNYEILRSSTADNWIVDLQNRKCSCRKWIITGIPCKHAISAIWAKHDDVIEYVDDCYTVDTYRKIYEKAIFPISGSQLWAKSNKVPPLPPRPVRQNKRGRNQNLRRRESDEAGSTYVTKPGHNKRKCKLNHVESEVGVHDSAFWMPPTSTVSEKLPVKSLA
ncbi:PREDICTED: uncharacterized protein LOC109217534 [Nicotiana attenuata]|uniref:uncharacterized protein LOC109217534 n=1 Tax=Nicotiana attenuata TaxID=49451 RepID=UPI0009056A6A|nr:PREDICTED: uncharacterized protein LOC109217534 [Nicotiana attenuata]